jgi:hypothetical protein
MEKSSMQFLKIWIGFVVGAAFASIVTLLFMRESGWIKFIGWFIFYLSISSPFVSYPKNSIKSCTNWLGRLRKGGDKI